MATIAFSSSLAPMEARAQGSGPDVSSGIAGGLVILAVGGGVVIGGLVTDGLVLHDLAEGQGVRRSPAIAGTVLWGLTSAVMLTATLTIFANGGTSGEAVAALLASDAVAFSSLGISIYGLSLPSPNSSTAPWSQRISAFPTMIPAARGAAPGIAIGLSL